MPIYEFICEKCSNEFEELIRGQEEITKCPVCGDSQVKRKISLFAVEGGNPGGTCPTTCNRNSCSSCG